jgi:hypothetical protein
MLLMNVSIYNEKVKTYIYHKLQKLGLEFTMEISGPIPILDSHYSLTNNPPRYKEVTPP